MPVNQFSQKQHIIKESKNEAHEEIVKKDEIIDSTSNVNDVITQVNEEAKEILLEEKLRLNDTAY